jgi:molecular chaperone IbpA
MVLNFTDPVFTSRVFGFENLFDRLQRISEGSDRSSSYPPYNIRRNDNRISIEVAVAGLSKNDLAIELADGNEVIYQGIAQRSFKLQFTVAEHVEVLGAELINGMLTLELEKIVPEEKKPRTIEIKAPKKLLGN